MGDPDERKEFEVKTKRDNLAKTSMLSVSLTLAFLCGFFAWNSGSPVMLLLLLPLAWLLLYKDYLK